MMPRTVLLPVCCSSWNATGESCCGSPAGRSARWISGRHDTATATSPHEMLEHVKKGAGSRYTCVNLTNCDTIEFRMFRGTLKLNTLLATLQMVDHICDVAFYLSDDELRDLSWSNFVSGIKEPELIQYLKERNLYVNEPIAAEGEI